MSYIYYYIITLLPTKLLYAVKVTESQIALSVGTFFDIIRMYLNGERNNENLSCSKPVEDSWEKLQIAI